MFFAIVAACTVDLNACPQPDFSCLPFYDFGDISSNLSKVKTAVFCEDEITCVLYGIFKHR